MLEQANQRTAHVKRMFPYPIVLSHAQHTAHMEAHTQQVTPCQKNSHL